MLVFLLMLSALVRASETLDPSEGVEGYRSFAVEHSPAVAAAYARWEAAAHQASGVRALPDPRVGLGVFVRAVETRVGPQQARLSVQQALPWPAEWRGRTDAAGAVAEARAEDLAGTVRALHQQIETDYWRLWRLREERVLHQDHLAVLEGLSDVVRARLEVGRATLADLQQVDLSAARLRDGIETLGAEEARAAAGLRAHLGLTDDRPLPTPKPPKPPGLPQQDDGALRALAAEHPAVLAARQQAAAADATVQAAKAQRLPGLSLSADWILTGPAEQADMVDSGKDAVAVGVGLTLPLWQRAYAANIDAARAQARAAEATQDAASLALTAEISQVSAQVQDTARRVTLTAETLLPQAEAAYASLLGSYTTGDGTVAQVLLAQRDLLELRVSLVQAQAAHATAWATLEALCGPLTSETP